MKFRALVGLLCGVAALSQSPRFSRLNYASPVVYNDEQDYAAVGVGDFDGDGDLDLLGNRGYIFNDGQGRFAAGPQPAALSAFGGLRIVGDSDGDGKAESLSISTSSAPSALWTADATGTPTQLPLSLPAFPSSTTLAVRTFDDFDGDGDQDVVILGYTGNTQIPPGPTPFFFVASNQGGGVFTAVTPFAPGGNFIGLAIGDFDGDGDRDWLGRDKSIVGAPNLRIAWNSGGSFALSPPFGAVGDTLVSTAVADFTGDGLVDIVMAKPSNVPPLYAAGFDALMVNLGGGSFATQYAALAGGFSVLGAFDFDLDGTPDLLRGYSRGAATVHHVAAAGIDPTPFALTDDVQFAGDFDGDGDADAVDLDVVGLLRLRLAVPGSGLVDASETPFRTLSWAQLAAAGDFDGDGDQDVASYQLDQVGQTYWDVRYQTAPGRFEIPPGVSPPIFGATPNMGVGSTGGVVLTTADLDGDGADEIVVAGLLDLTSVLNQSKLVVYKRLPNGQLQQTIVGTAPQRSRRATAFDADGDGDLDLAVVADAVSFFGPTESSRLYLNQGGLVFASSNLGIPHFGSDIAAVDLDLDGDLDLLQANTGTLGAAQPTTAFTNLGGGGFSETTFAPSTFGRSVAVGDLDLDGDVDVVIGAVPLFRTPGGFVAGPAAPFPNGFVGYSALADMTDDGWLDLATIGGFTPGLGAAGFGPYTEMRPWNLGLQPTFSLTNSVSARDLDRDGDVDVMDGYGRIFWNLTRHLEIGLVPAIGRVAALDVYGTPGEPFSLFLSLTPAAPLALPPFGTLFVDASSAVHVFAGGLDAAGHATVATPIPNVPSFDGVELYWQCLHFGQARLGTAQFTTLRNY